MFFIRKVACVRYSEVVHHYMYNVCSPLQFTEDGCVWGSTRDELEELTLLQLKLAALQMQQAEQCRPSKVKQCVASLYCVVCLWLARLCLSIFVVKNLLFSRC